jgi:hypothetical protein
MQQKMLSDQPGRHERKAKRKRNKCVCYCCLKPLLKPVQAAKDQDIFRCFMP